MLDSDAKLYEAEVTLLAILLGGMLLAWLTMALGARWPGLRVGPFVAAAFAARCLVVLSFPLLGDLGDDLRTDDDQLYLNEASRLSEEPLTSGLWHDDLFGDLHVSLFALQLKLLGGPGGTSLRIMQAALAAAAIALIATAVHRLGGPRAAVAAGWFLALEPASVLFTSILHEEALILLGEGAVLVGLAASWAKRDFRGLPLVLLGLAVPLATRTYAGGFLAVAATLVYAHLLWSGTGPARQRRRWTATALVGGVLLAGGLFAAGGDALQRAHNLQNADPAVANNLQLEPVDYSTVGGLARGVPVRMLDFAFRPFPWQARNLSQALGVVSTLLTWSLYVLLAFALWSGGLRASATRVAPFLYVGAWMVVAYALSTGNAGTGFRHRIHLLVPLVAAVSVLLADRLPSLSARWSSATAAVRGGRP